MANLLELTIRHLQQHGMTTTEATAMLSSFTKGQGRDLPWNQLAPSVPRLVAERIDRAAVGWMMARKACDQDEEPAVEPVVRDGKMLATGEGS